MKRFSVVSLIGSVAMIISISTVGCKKAEQPAEAPKESEQAQSPVAVAGSPIAEFSFDDSIQGWGARGKDIKLDVSNATKHSGSSSLKISGKSSSEMWNYAASKKVNLESGKKYRLSGWMFVESISDPKAPPFLKIGIAQQANPPKFITNVNTKRYDLAKKGEWQELSAVFTAPSEPGIHGNIAVEKGKKAVIDVTLYLDDVKTEPVQ